MSMWRIWAKALGQKDGRDDREADIIAGIRTIILVSYMVTNIAIVANAVRHWNDQNHKLCNYVDVAELVDALVLGTSSF